MVGEIENDFKALFLGFRLSVNSILAPPGDHFRR